VAIVECILQGTMRYLREWLQQTSLIVQNPQMVYCKEMIAIIEEISAKGTQHRVEWIGNQDFVFEVMVREKGGVGIGSAMVTMEC
jgi:disulfide oxidoreductase YuzD